MNNRQNGRRRGRSNNNSNARQPGQSRNHDQGNRIDNRARGNATQLLEKYRNMARDAQLSGDRVMTEYYLQFADHYFRVLSDARVRQDEQRARFEEREDGRDDGRDDGREMIGDSDDGNNDGDELDAIDMIGRAPRNRDGRDGRENRPQRNDREPRESRPERDNRDVDSRGRDNRDRDNRDRSDRDNRNGRSNGNGNGTSDSQADGNRSDHDGNRQNGSAPLGERPRRPRRERTDMDDNAPLSIDVAVLPPAIGIEDAPMVTSDSDEPVAPKRRGRPRKADAEGEGAAV